MKKILIVFLIIVFSSNLSLADNEDKITLKDIEEILFPKDFRKIQKPEPTKEEKKYIKMIKESNKSEQRKKRRKTRGPASCMYTWYDSQGIDLDEIKRCHARAIMAILTYPEKSKKRRPGDVFFAVQAIGALTGNGGWNNRPGSNSWPMIFEFKKGRYDNKLRKSYQKKLDKFKKDPSNEKVLGHKLIKFIKQEKTKRKIAEKIGIKSFYYTLLADMLNDMAGEVKTNKLNPSLKKRSALLKKYSLVLNDIKQSLKDEDYKSLNKKNSLLSKTFDNLKALPDNQDNLISSVDQAVYIMTDINKFTQEQILSSSKKESSDTLIFSLINFIDFLIDTILYNIPEKYSAEPKPLTKDLWSENELILLEKAINDLLKHNKKNKINEINKSIKIINKFNSSINPENVINSLEDLGFVNKLKTGFEEDSALEIANEALMDNLNKDIFKDSRKILAKLSKEGLNEINKELAETTSQISQEIGQSKDIQKSLYEQRRETFIKVLIICRQGRGFHSYC